ncbi:DUF1048 domain-containing protein [Herbidospora cretacea]|uniref:DUF1048 domain-containing protein n=1 Tax=Herbidospora cretacea TaxID=28444 RepID=UPI0009DE7F77|nr:DUF1048 domain-containing protein [Herbidospora cretacea]
MNLWDTVTGNDLTREWRAFAARAGKLPPGHQAAWAQIQAQLFLYGDFTGRNLMPILDGALALLEETAADGRTVHEALGDDIPGFCAALAGGHGARTFRDRWRARLNRRVARRLGVHDVIDGKRRWRAQMARVRALPPDYRIVYKEVQRYLFKVGSAELLSGILDFFEEGAADGKGVRELIGGDVAAFCDDLIGDAHTHVGGAA